MPLLAVPKNVLRFERLGYLTVVFGSVAAMLANWPTIIKFSQQYPIAYPVMIAFVWILQLSWIWIIARKRQNWARWVSIATIAFGILMEAMNFKAKYQANPMAELVNCLIYLMWIVEFSFLFMPDAKIWFAMRPGPVSPSA